MKYRIGQTLKAKHAKNNYKIVSINKKKSKPYTVEFIGNDDGNHRQYIGDRFRYKEHQLESRFVLLNSPRETEIMKEYYV